MLCFRMTITIAGFLVFFMHSSCEQHVPYFNREAWLNPPNQRNYQRMTLQRMLSVMDVQVDPCEDFYQFACGNYRNMIPERSRAFLTNPGMEVLYLSENIVDRYMNLKPADFMTGTERKLRDFLVSCINSKDNLQSTMDFIKSFGNWPALDSRWSERHFDWTESLIALMKNGAHRIFNLKMDTAVRNRVDVGIVSLVINRTYIFGEEIQTSDSVVEKIERVGKNVIPIQYMNDMIPRVIAFFNQMRQVFQNSAIKTEGNEFYLHELQRQAPGCDFAKIFKLLTGRRYEATETIIVPYIDYVENACQLIQRTDKRTLADFFFVQLLIQDADSRKVSGMDEKALKEHCEEEAKVFFQSVITANFSRHYVPKETIEEVLNLTSNLQKVGIEMILSNTSWLDEHTRRKAAKKMEVVTPRIGYPDYMASEEELSKIYSNVEIDAANYLQNQKNLFEFLINLDYNLIGKDYSYVSFNPLKAEPEFIHNGRGTLHVQAAALIPPNYHKYAPSFVKHSTVLSILGHELMHNFDVTGIKIDEHGKYSQWMTANRYLTYNYRSECFFSQYGQFKLDNSDIHVKGADTLAENVADNDGVKLAFELFKQWIAANPDKVWEEEFTFAPLQVTHEQAFFLSYAQMWCDASSLEYLVWQIDNDEHAPNKFRVIGPLSNLPDFAKAFNCPANSKMNPVQKCSYFFD